MAPGPRRPPGDVEATRQALIAVARKHCTRHGYVQAEISRIADDARVTTSAIYHHFSSKKDLFQAVADNWSPEIVAAAATVTEADPWRRLRVPSR